LGGPVTRIDTEVFRKQFDVNFFGLIDVTKAYLPLLGASKESSEQGKIINISSINGCERLPLMELIFIIFPCSLDSLLAPSKGR
jgi:NAD(P)-dependent dehydrogenase (short-subunit alcohol dehydrogenase family)